MRRQFICLGLSIILLAGCSGRNSRGVSLKFVDALDLPCAVDSLDELVAPQTALAVGEYESAAFLLETGEPLNQEPISLKGLPADMSVEIHRVAPYRRKLRGEREITSPYLLERSYTVSAAAGDKAVYYLTFKTGAQTPPGDYPLELSLAGASAALTLKVRPFKLYEDPFIFYGAFCGARDVDITPAQLADLAQRGFDALQFFWGSVSVGLANVDDSLAIDFTTVDRWMEDFRKAGMAGPVVWSMGNDHRSHLENRLAGLFNLSRKKPETIDGKTLDFADIHNPRLNSLLKQVFLAIRDHAKEKGWPEIVFIIYDEPTERLMAEHEDRYRLLKSFWPELRIYGVTMDRIEWAAAISHMVDIFVANGDFDKISALADSTGKPFWLYGSASSRNAAALRHSYAWIPWAHRAKGVWFWAYNYGNGDPYDDFDGSLAESSASMVWPPRTPGDPPVYSVSWEGMREAADDMRYITTLEYLLKNSQSSRAGEIRAELEKIRASVPQGRMEQVLGGEAQDRVQVLEGRKYVVGLREKVASWIEELLKEEKEPFGPVRL